MFCLLKQIVPPPLNPYKENIIANIMATNLFYNNINGFNKRKHQLYHYIQNESIDCVLLVETKTRPSDRFEYQHWKTINKQGYQLTNHPRGGSLVQAAPKLKLIKENPPRLNNPLNECIHFALPFEKEKLHIFLIYIHHTSKIEETIFTKASLYKYSMIIGDWNFNNRKNKQLDNFLRNANFIKGETAPTFLMQNNTDSTPDAIVYSKNLKDCIKKIEVVPDLGSDHLGFRVELDLKTELTEEKARRLNYAKSNLPKINAEIIQFIAEQEQTISINQVHMFNQKVSEIIKQNTPLSKQSHFGYPLPPFIIRLIKEKRKMLREYYSGPSPEIKSKINKYGKDIQALIFKYKENSWLKTCKEINDDQGKTFYTKIRKLTHYKAPPPVPDLEENGVVFSTNREKANIFLKYYKEHFKEREHPNFDKNFEEEINEWYRGFFEDQDGADQDKLTVDPNDYYKIVHTQKNSAPGADNIPWQIVKQFEPIIHEHIIKILEFCINKKCFPDPWKRGTIINIPKPRGDHTQPENYRPITLLPVLGKIYEKLIRNRLGIIANAKIPNHQFGFREGHSTIHPLVILASNVETAKQQNMKSAALFLDIEKAFDSVWHKGLLYKLHELGVPRYIIDITKNFLENRTITIKVNSYVSGEFTPMQGVPQGSPLSPLLYNIYCHDIAENILDIDKTKYILQFADDTSLISHGKSTVEAANKLQNIIRSVEPWFYKWRLTPNPQKSQYILFNHTVHANSPHIDLFDLPIEPKPSAKYLGVEIDAKLNFNKHTKAIKTKTINRAKHFRSLTYKNQGINTKTAAKIYKSICRPVLEYGHVLYLNLKPPALKNIKTAETASLRAITKMRHPQNPLHNPSNGLLYTRTKIQPILERMEQLTVGFAKREQNLLIIEPLCRRRHQGQAQCRYPAQTILEGLLAISNN